MTKREYIISRRTAIEEMAVRGVEVADLFALRVVEHYEAELKKTGIAARARRVTGLVFGCDESTIRRYISRLSERAGGMD